jgi:hypothetical protein
LSNISQLLIDDLKSLFTQDVLGDISIATLDEIDKYKNEKTEQGLEPLQGNTPFAPYDLNNSTKKYAKYKQRTSPYYNGGTVNLRYTAGKASITDTSKTKVNGWAELSFNQEGKGELFAKHQDGEGRLPKRKLFPESTAEVPNEWDEFAVQAINKVINAVK